MKILLVYPEFPETRKLQYRHRNLQDSVKKIRSYGLEVMAGVIVGFDNDPEEIFERRIEFIRENAIPPWF